MHITLFTRLPMQPPPEVVAEQQQEHCAAASRKDGHDKI
jgi:hypothetical protein